MFWNKPKWSICPGCYERHLQRRYENILFPPERRKVSKDDIIQARKNDEIDQHRFIKEVQLAESELENLEYDNRSYAIQRIQALLEEAAAIGGETIQNAVQLLEQLEEDTIQYLNKVMPEGKELLEKAKSLSFMARIPFIAQCKRQDTPILPNEEIPTLFCESFETLATLGFISRSFPDFKPSGSDIRNYLETAVKQGFSKDEAQSLISAWNEMKSNNL
jgi:hypothetical protein